MQPQVVAQRARHQVGRRPLHHLRAREPPQVGQGHRARRAVQRARRARQDLDGLGAPLERIADGDPVARRPAERHRLRHLVGVRRHVPQRLEHERVRGAHALAERDVAVAFQQQVHPAGQPAVVAAEPRMVRVRQPSLAHGRRRVGLGARVEHALVLDEVAVPASVQAVVGAQRRRHRRQQALAHVEDGLRAAALDRVRDVVRHREAVHRAVGGVVVDGQVGRPRLADARLQQAHLGRGIAQIVAVQVDLRGVLARAHAAVGAQLAPQRRQVQRAVARVDGVVAVGVEQRRDHQRDVLQDLLRVQARLAGEQVARQHQAAFLALHLAGMDAAENQHHRPAQAARFGGRLHAGCGQHQQRQLTPAGAGAEVRDVQARVAHRREPGDERHHVGVQARERVAA